MRTKRLIAMLLGSALVAASLPTAAFAQNIEGQAVVEASAEDAGGTEQELAPSTSGQDTTGSYKKSTDNTALSSITLENAASTATDKTITDSKVPYQVQAETTEDGKTTTSWEYSKLEFTGAATADGTTLSADKFSALSYKWEASDKEDGTFSTLDETSDTLTLTRDILLKTPYVKLTVTGTANDTTYEGSTIVQVTRVSCPTSRTPTGGKVDDDKDTFTFTGVAGVTYAYKLGDADAVTLSESKDGTTNSDDTVTYTISVGDKAYAAGAVQVYAVETDAEKAAESDILYAASEPISNDTAYTVKDKTVSYTSTDKDKYAEQVFTAVFAPATDSTADVAALASEQATIAAVDRKNAIMIAENDDDSDSDSKKSSSSDTTTTTDSGDDDDTDSDELEADDIEEAISADSLTPTELSTSLSVTTSSGTTTVPVGTILSISSAASGSTTASTAQYLVGAVASANSATLYATTASSGTNAVYTYNTSANTLVKGSSTVTLTDKSQHLIYKGVPYKVSYTVKSGDTLYAYLYKTDGSAAGYATLDSTGTKATALALNTGYTKDEDNESTYYEADDTLYEVTDLFAQNITAKDSSDAAITTGADGTLTITIKDSDVIKDAVDDTNPIGLIRKGSAYTSFSTAYDDDDDANTLTATVSDASLDSNTDYLIIDENDVSFTSLKTVAASTKATSSTASTTSSTSSSTSSAKTGDESSATLWAVVMLIAAGAIVALVVVSRRRKNK